MVTIAQLKERLDELDCDYSWCKKKVDYEKALKDALKGGDGGEDEAEEDEEQPPAKKAKTTESVKDETTPPRRGARVDRTIRDTEYSVHEDYSIKLNQTNVGDNNNKFYLIQLLTKDNGSDIVLFTRYGRVGENGRSDFKKQKDIDSGISAFEKQFKSKTANDWNERFSFVKKNKKYNIVETEEAEGDDGNNEEEPMGRLSKSQIEKGQNVLERLETAINQQDQEEYVHLSSEFYTLIPTSFGRRKPPAMSTIEIVREKQELLKFYLRMGFEDVNEEPGLTPIEGVMKLACPASLAEAAIGICAKSSVSSSDSMGVELEEKQAGNPVKHMKAALYAAIMLYTSNAIYAALNKVLRDENRSGVKKYFPYLRLFFEAMKHLPQTNRTLWRGISVDLSKQYTVGSTITWWGVSSCTSEESVARGFMNGCGGSCSFLTIDTKTAIDISSITFYSNEKESLLAPGTQLLVKSCKMNGKVAEIHLEEVGNAVN